MVSFNRIGGVDDSPDIRRVLKVSSRLVSSVADDNRIVIIPLEIVLVESLSGNIFIDGLIYKFEAFHELLLFFARDLT